MILALIIYEEDSGLIYFNNCTKLRINPELSAGFLSAMNTMAKTMFSWNKEGITRINLEDHTIEKFLLMPKRELVMTVFYYNGFAERIFKLYQKIHDTINVYCKQTDCKKYIYFNELEQPIEHEIEKYNRTFRGVIL